MALDRFARRALVGASILALTVSQAIAGITQGQLPRNGVVLYGQLADGTFQPAHIDDSNNLLVTGVGGGGGAGDASAALQTAGNASLVSILAGVGAIGDAAWTTGNGSLIAVEKSNNGKLATLITDVVALGAGALVTDAHFQAIVGSKAPGTAATSAALIGGVYTSPGVTLTNGQEAAFQLSAAGRLLVDGSAITQPVSGTFWQATQPVSVADGSNVTEGAKADSAYAGSGSASIVAILKGIYSAIVSPLATQAGTVIVGGVGIDSANNVVKAPLYPNILLPSSTQTQTSSTTAYTALDLIANNATAGSITVSSLSITNNGGAIQRMRLSTNDATSTAWGGKTIYVDLWSAAPTFTNGDNGAYALATGAGSHIAQFTCLMSAENGDGAFAECIPLYGSVVTVSVGTVYWSMESKDGSGVTGASKVWTLKAETMN